MAAFSVCLKKWPLNLYKPEEFLNEVVLERRNLKQLKKTESLQLENYFEVKFTSVVNKDEIIELICSFLEQQASKRSESDCKNIEFEKVKLW